MTRLMVRGTRVMERRVLSDGLHLKTCCEVVLEPGSLLFDLGDLLFSQPSLIVLARPSNGA